MTVGGVAFVLALVAASLFPARPAASPPDRVASLNLTADEVLVEILPPERLVAVTAFADDATMSNVAGRVSPSVVRLPRADIERLVDLAPDLVVVSEYTDADFLRVLERSGLRVHRMSGLDSLAGFRSAILSLARAVGAEEAAARLVSRYDAVLAELSRRLAGVRRPRVLYWSEPHTAGEGTAIGALIEAAGGVNVGRELGLKGITPVGAERAFLAHPDAVLVGTWEGATASLKSHPLLSRLPAVQEGRIVEMPTPLLVTLSHHAAEACWYLGWALHPDRIPRPRP